MTHFQKCAKAILAGLSVWIACGCAPSSNSNRQNYDIASPRARSFNYWYSSVASIATVSVLLGHYKNSILSGNVTSQHILAPVIINNILKSKQQIATLPSDWKDVKENLAAAESSMDALQIAAWPDPVPSTMALDATLSSVKRFCDQGLIYARRHYKSIGGNPARLPSYDQEYKDFTVRFKVLP